MLLEFSSIDSLGIIAIFIAMFLGGVLKGVTGAGMPIIAVPVIAAFYDVRLAIIILVIPNLLTNLWQIHKFKAFNTEFAFSRKYAFAGFLGAGLGTILLSWAPVEQLNILMALIVFSYIGLKLSKPTFKLAMARANQLVWLVGISGGLLHGSIGISSPISVTFANAIKLDRPVFIYTISLYFTAMTLSQLPLHIAYGMMTWQTVSLGSFAFIPLIIGLYAGEMIGKRMNVVVFDRVILVMLAVLSIKQIINVIF